MKIVKENKFIIISIMISLVGFFGVIVPYGEEKWNFVFENLMWLPIELLITISVLEKIMEKNKKKQEMHMFIKLSGTETMELLSIVKHKLYSALTAEMIMDEDELNKKMDGIYEDFTSIYTVEHFRKGLDIYVVDTTKDVFKDSFKKNINYQVSLLKYSFEINELIDNYIRKNEFLIPTDVYIEIIKLRDVLQNSFLFRVDSSFKNKINLYSQNLPMDEKNVKSVLFEMESIYKGTYNYIRQIHNLLKENAPS